MIKSYIERLLNEWKQHGKIIIAVDFDDTIYPWGFKSEEDHKRFDQVINLIKECKTTGAYITMWSACSPDRYDEITSYCASKGLEIDSINTNPIELPYGKDKKIYANIFLDDRAGLFEAMQILSDALYQYRGYLQQQKPATDVA